MKGVIDPLKRRQVGRAFYLHIPIAGKCEEEIQQALAEAREVEKAVENMLDGSMSVNDLLESVEHIFPDMDQYVDNVEEQLILLH
jgi:hypothetical protein